MSWTPTPGATFQIPTGHNRHLSVICLGPFVVPGGSSKPQFLFVPLCSFTDPNRQDGTCVLQPAEHPFVLHPTYVAYRHARVEEGQAIAAKAASGVYLPHATPFADHVLRRIANGICISRFTNHHVRALAGCR
jgi:hypothetical protein